MNWKNRNIQRSNLLYTAYLYTEIPIHDSCVWQKIEKYIIYDASNRTRRCRITSGNKILKTENSTHISPYSYSQISVTRSTYSTTDNGAWYHCYSSRLVQSVTGVHTQNCFCYKWITIRHNGSTNPVHKVQINRENTIQAAKSLVQCHSQT
jgi:hypothetical protein